MTRCVHRQNSKYRRLTEVERLELTRRDAALLDALRAIQETLERVIGDDIGANLPDAVERIADALEATRKDADQPRREARR